MSTSPGTSPVHVLDPAGGDIQIESTLLRDRGPVVRVLLPGGVAAWLLTRHDVIKRLLTDSRLSRDPNQHWPAWQAGEITPDWPLFSWVAVTNMFTAYGADHRRLRRLVAAAFTARRTVDLRPRVEQITTELLDAIAETPAGGVVDLRQALGSPLPTQVVCELFGIPADQRPAAARLVDSIFDTTAGPDEVRTTFQSLTSLLTDLVAARRGTPGPDLTSALITAQDEGFALNDQELVDTLMLMLSAGHETTTNLICNAAHALLTHPEELRRVRAGELSWGDVVEETLRWAPSIARVPLRYAVDDIAVGDVVIRAGDPVLLDLAAAGRDPGHFGDRAVEFAPGAEGHRDHLAFGHGVHHCFGAPLARMEATIALFGLFTRFPNLVLAVEPSDLKPVRSLVTNSHTGLPVRPYPLG